MKVGTETNSVVIICTGNTICANLVQKIKIASSRNLSSRLI